MSATGCGSSNVVRVDVGDMMKSAGLIPRQRARNAAVNKNGESELYQLRDSQPAEVTKMRKMLAPHCRVERYR